MKRWFSFRILSILAIFTASIMLTGCGGVLSHVSRPGNPEDFEEYRHATVALVEQSSGGNMVGPNCTAFFISPRRLATAEHCVVDRGQVVEVLPGMGRRVPPETPEPTVGREILFVSYEAEAEYFAQERRSLRGPEFHRTTVVAVDHDNDVAILELVDNEEDWTSWFELRNLEENPLLVGEIVYSISNPVGHTFVLTEGRVARIRTVDTTTRIFHQDRIGPGSSGSALLDRRGRVVGVNIAITRGNVLSITTPISYVKTQLELLENRQETQEEANEEEE